MKFASTERKTALNKQKIRLNVYFTILCALFASLIAAGAYIKIPLPLVPVTLQLQFALLAGILLGPNKGALSCLVYALAGLAGIPVFTGGGGIQYIVSPTFGYIAGFIAGAFAAGHVVKRFAKRGTAACFASFSAGTLAVYISGLVYLYLIKRFSLGEEVDLRAFFLSALLIPLAADTVKNGVFAALAARVLPLTGKYIV